MIQALTDYGRMEEAAPYFIHEAFRNIHFAAQCEVAGFLLGPLIENIGVPENWEVPELPTDLPGLLDSENDVVPDETAAALAAAWHDAQIAAATSKQRLPTDHPIRAIDLAGHCINLAAAVEVMVNRELLLRREQGLLPSSIIKDLDRAPVVAKLHVLYRDKIHGEAFELGQIRALFRLRNTAVHLGPLKTDTLRATPQQLLQIWSAVGDLASITRGNPSKSQIGEYTKSTRERWFQ